MSKIDELLKNEKVEWKKLGEVCDILDYKRKPINKSKRIYGEYPYFGANGIQDYVESYIFDGNFILMGEDGSVMNKDNSPVLHWIENSKIWVNNHAHVLGEKNRNWNLKYIYYYLTTVDVSAIVKGTPPKINQGNLKLIEIPIPSLKTQEKIVKTLDKFTNYVTELQAKLQTELQYRIKQYEHYRNMLLSEEHLNKLCDNSTILGRGAYGIRSTTLGEVGIFTRGNGLQKKDFVLSGKPVIHYGQIYTKYNFETDKTFSFVNNAIYAKLKKAKHKDILIATTSENIEDVGKAVVWLGDEEVGFSGDMYSYSTTENSKYIAYYFQTMEFQKQKEKKVTGTKLIRIHGDDMANFSISLPPQEIQNKVVEILDKFQDLLSDTRGLLPHEIEKRQKQYEYYREKLLTFDTECGSKQASKQASKQIIPNSYFILLKEAAGIVGVKVFGVERKKLKDIAQYSSEKVLAESLNEKNYVGVENLLKYKMGKVDSNYVPEIGNLIAFKRGNILVGNIRPYLRKIWMADIDGGTNGDVLVISIKEDVKNIIVPRFLYHILSNESFFEYDIKFSKGAKMPRGDKMKIMEYGFVLPPLPVQEYVVSVLDKFETLINDTSQGLPKEIELRHKQYEYFREKLLNFERSC